jgi:hypothetical protein
MRFVPYLFFALLLSSGPAISQTAPLQKSEMQEIVNKAGDLLVAAYVFPDRAAEAKAKINSLLAAGSYDGLTDPVAFANRVTTDLQSVTHDKHVKIVALSSEPNTQIAPSLPTNSGFFQVDRLKGNIGYIKLLGFPLEGPFDLAAQQAMKALAGTDALIIDMRDNGGGSAASVNDFDSYFFDPKSSIHLIDFIDRKTGTNEFNTVEFWTKPISAPYLNKPVAVLISNKTFSGGEASVYELKTQGRAKIFGQPSSGGANPGGFARLNERFRIFIPTARAESPVTKSSWEGAGIIPDTIDREGATFHDAMLDLLVQLSAKGARSDSALAEAKTLVTKGKDIDDLVEAHLLKFRTEPLAGSAEAIRQVTVGIARGMPPFDKMDDDLAKAIRAQLSSLQREVGQFGALKAVSFNSVSNAGLDVYDMTFERGVLQGGIFVEPGGKISSYWENPPS